MKRQSLHFYFLQFLLTTLYVDQSIFNFPPKLSFFEALPYIVVCIVHSASIVCQVVYNRPGEKVQVMLKSHSLKLMGGQYCVTIKKLHFFLWKRLRLRDNDGFGKNNKKK